jgi:hypothetical protein
VYQSNEPTPRQKNAYMSYEDLVAIRNALPDHSIDKVLIGMYTCIPPARCDYGCTLITDTDQGLTHTDNYIVLNGTDHYLCIQKYKTATTHGTIVLDLPPDLVDIIKKNIALAPRKYLFLTPRSQQPFPTTATFSHWANKRISNITMSKGLTVTSFRHIYLSRRDINIEEQSGTHRQTLATAMGHSLGTQQRYLWHSWLRTIESPSTSNIDQNIIHVH